VRNMIALTLAVLTAGGSVTACTSFKGQPEPVISTSGILDVADLYALPGAYTAYQSKNSSDRAIYRNEYIFVQMAAIDAQYDGFRSQLRVERKSLDLGFDALLLILSGAGSLAPKAASDLAVVSSGTVGFRGAVNRDVFFDRTLAAVLASMDAERFRIASAMSAKMDRADSEYPLAAAIGDLRAYQLAGTLDSAIARLERSASADADNAKKDFDRDIRYACSAKQEVVDAVAPLGALNWKIMRAAIDAEGSPTASATRLELQKLGALYGVSTEGSNEELGVGIAAALGSGFCTVDDVEAFKVRVRAALPAAKLQ
jgi:hypothetical protein